MDAQKIMDEVLSKPPTLREKVRKIFASECARIEQANEQRKPPTPIEVIIMEYKAVDKIIEAINED